MFSKNTGDTDSNYRYGTGQQVHFLITLKPCPEGRNTDTTE